MDGITITLLLTIMMGIGGGGKWMLSVIEKKSEERDKDLKEKINKLEKRIDKIFSNIRDLNIAFSVLKKEWMEEKERRSYLEKNKKEKE